ncbi:MAG: GerMN domain-containing protein [Actinobacteria bacterium]|nr:GerMN domain-containing protein [Actinomycetota bacterium]
MVKLKHIRKRKGRGALWVFVTLVIIAVLAGVYYLYLKGYFGDITRASNTEPVSEINLETDVSSKETDIASNAGSDQSVSETETTTSGSDQHGESTAADSSVDVEEVKEETSQSTEKPIEENISVPDKLDINIYFSDAQGEFLVGEKRHVEGDDIMIAVANELIKGPTLPNIYPTIPDGTVIRSMEVGSGVAYVNFSRELVVNHVEGAAAETMTVYSIVNTLTGIPGVNAVQILVEGVKIKSIDGHIDISMPLTRNESLIKK